MVEQRDQAFLQMGENVPVDDHYQYPVWFIDGTDRIIEHAVVLKWFNGASNGHYCYWDNTYAIWDFNETNNLGSNYVARVCSTVAEID
jgi:hypothetical protein